MYQSIPSLTITPGDPRGLARSHCLGGGGRDFESDKFFYSFQRQVQELLDLFQRNWGQLEKQVSCAVSCQLLQKQ